MVKLTKGALVEYALSVPPLALFFEFNPSSITRTRSISVKTGGSRATRGGYDFTSPTETPRASQGVSVNAESFTVKILLDATDRMNDPSHVSHDVVMEFGVQPELDTIFTMVEPKSQTPDGAQTLSALGQDTGSAIESDETSSVLLFVWGKRILPVFMTQAQIEEQAYLPSLVPYRAEATLTLQLIESNNPFHDVEKARRVVSVAMNTGVTAAAAIGSLF